MNPKDDGRFRSAYLKFERAEKHFHEVAGLIGWLFDVQNKILCGEDEEYFGHDRLLDQPVPAMLPAVIGDMFHNLRASLDHAYCALIERNGGTPGAKASSNFPFRKTNDIRNWLNGINRAENPVDIPSPAVIDYIVDKMQPYEGGEGGLYLLHEFDIFDKHKIILPTGRKSTINEIIEFDFPDGSVARLQGISLGSVYSYGKPNGCVVIPAGAKGKPDNKGKITIDISFENGPLAGKEIIPEVNRYRNSVFKHLRTLDQLSK